MNPGRYLNKYCFNPADPTLYRYPMTEPLMDEGFVECPPPGEAIPTTLLGGAGGVLDQAAAVLAQQISKQLGPNASEAQLKAFSEAIGRLDPENLAALAEPVQKPQTITETAPPPVGAVGSAMDVTGIDGSLIADGTIRTEDVDVVPAADVTTDTDTDSEAPPLIQEMFDFPQVEVTEPAESAVERFFGKRMADVTKNDILNHSLKTLKVKLDAGKRKPELIRDLQIVEIARQA